MPVRIGPRFLDKVNLCCFGAAHFVETLSDRSRAGHNIGTLCDRQASHATSCPILLPRAGCTAAVKVADKLRIAVTQQGIGPYGKSDVYCRTLFAKRDRLRHSQTVQK
jgi:hypothetical protein